MTLLSSAYRITELKAIKEQIEAINTIVKVNQ